MRDVVASLFELVGLGTIVVGAWETFGMGPGLMVGGVVLVTLGVVSA